MSDLDYDAVIALALMPDLTNVNAKQVGALLADRLALRAALAMYRYEDCPECMARSKMVSDVEDHGGFSVVRPTGVTITHDVTCSIGKLMATIPERVADSVSEERKP